MNPLQKRIIEVLTADVSKWEKAAKDVETMLPNIPEPDHEHWKATAQGYREQAKEYMSLLEQLKSQRDV